MTREVAENFLAEISKLFDLREGCGPINPRGVQTYVCFSRGVRYEVSVIYQSYTGGFVVMVKKTGATILVVQDDEISERVKDVEVLVRSGGTILRTPPRVSPTRYWPVNEVALA